MKHYHSSDDLSSNLSSSYCNNRSFVSLPHYLSQKAILSELLLSNYGLVSTISFYQFLKDILLWFSFFWAHSALLSQSRSLKCSINELPVSNFIQAGLGFVCNKLMWTLKRPEPQGNASYILHFHLEWNNSRNDKIEKNLVISLCRLQSLQNYLDVIYWPAEIFQTTSTQQNLSRTCVKLLSVTV